MRKICPVGIGENLNFVDVWSKDRNSRVEIEDVRMYFSMGFIDEKDNEVIELKYDKVNYFSEGFAIFGIDKNKRIGGYVKYFEGYMNFYGITIQPRFWVAGDFSEGLAGVMDQNGKCGFIDQLGEYVIEPYFDGVGTYYKNVVRVGVKKFDIQKVAGSNFEREIILYGLIDKTGKYILEPEYDSMTDFIDDYAEVSKNGIKGYIDTTGKYYNNKPSLDPKKEILIKEFQIKKVKKFGYVDSNNKTIIEPIFDEASDFKDRMARVKIGKKWGLIDITGNFVIKPEYDNINNFFCGLARIKLNYKYGFIDETGKIVIKPKYDFAGDFQEVED